MAPLFEVLHLFAATRGHLLEIRRLDRPTDAPKSERYQWLWVEEGTVSTLHFLAIQEQPRQHRSFREAQLDFDPQRGELQWTLGASVPLRTMAAQDLPTTLIGLVNTHLS